MTPPNPNEPRHMIARARQLRRDAPFPERLLWSRLRAGRCAGLVFRRQHPIGRYVADFFCLQSRLVVELDGKSHETTVAEDEVRQQFIESRGLRVLRFTDDELLGNLDAVVRAIALACGAAER
ncbi:MAG: DUF559 domain-containing protein [Phycisphaerae bacterium]|nr:DUF559 domain-containing protein [Phycisphaerae bacterium]